jgi:hypothetical protein
MSFIYPAHISRQGCSPVFSLGAKLVSYLWARMEGLDMDRSRSQSHYFDLVGIAVLRILKKHQGTWSILGQQSLVYHCTQTFHASFEADVCKC